MKVNWQGVYPAVTTKFLPNDSIDFTLFKKNIQAQIDAGVDGIILGGSLGEASTLSLEEKMDLIKATREVVQDKAPIIMNIAERSTRVAVELAQISQRTGVDGLMLLPPMQYKATDEETVVYFETIARSTDLPIMIYNNPVDYKINVTLEMFETLVKHPNIQAVKESTRDVSNVTRILNKFGDRLKILCGVDTLALESMLLGAHGWVAGLVCAFPRETVAIYRLAKAGRVNEALGIYRWFLPILELDISPQLVQNIKLAEVMTGLGSEYVRAPRLPLGGKEREKILKVLEDGLAVRPTLPDYLNF